METRRRLHGHQGRIWKVTWRFIVLRRSLFSLFFSPVRDALAGLLREYERHDQAAALMRDKLTELNINACSIG